MLYPTNVFLLYNILLRDSVLYCTLGKLVQM